MANELVQTIADPHAVLSKIRARMPRDCSVRKSPFCDYIIAMRLQGISYNRIRDWLYDKSPEFAIPAPTLHRNLSKGIRHPDIVLTHAEELADKWGGALDLDLAYELSKLMLTQKHRIDKLVRFEQEKQKEKPGYSLRQIRGEMETFVLLSQQYQTLLENPEEAANQRAATDEKLKGRRVQIEPATEAELVEMVLDGRLGYTKTISNDSSDTSETSEPDDTDNPG